MLLDVDSESVDDGSLNDLLAALGAANRRVNVLVLAVFATIAARAGGRVLNEAVHGELEIPNSHGGDSKDVLEGGDGLGGSSNFFLKVVLSLVGVVVDNLALRVEHVTFVVVGEVKTGGGLFGKDSLPVDGEANSLGVSVQQRSCRESANHNCFC